MADTFFTATKDWQAMPLDAGETYTILSREDKLIHLTREATIPDASENGTVNLRKTGDAGKFTLNVGDTQYIKSASDEALVSIIPA